MLAEGGDPAQIVSAEGLQQVTDKDAIRKVVANVLAANPGAVEKYRSGKPTVEQWLFGQVMRSGGWQGQSQPGARGIAETTQRIRHDLILHNY